MTHYEAPMNRCDKLSFVDWEEQCHNFNQQEVGCSRRRAGYPELFIAHCRAESKSNQEGTVKKFRSAFSF